MKNKKSVSRPASSRGNPHLKLRVISRPVMKYDPIYLSEEASLGVLSVDGNFDKIIANERLRNI